MMKKVLFCSVAGLAFVAADAHAQVSASGGASAPVQQTPSDPGAAAADEDIVVTGIRASIQRAQDLKRGSGAVIEAVTFEDLGKFSDQNIADALQRVPGVQIVRDDSGSTGDRASVRGLGSQFLQTTVNGRTMISVGSNGLAANSLRSFNLDAVPTEIIAGMTLYKTPLAQNVEPGLAGELDISTLRPLDYKKGGDVFGSLLVRGETDNYVKTVKPRVSGVLGAKLFNDTLGIFVSGVIADTRSQIDTLTVGPYNRADLFFVNPNGGAPRKVSNVLTTPGGEFYNNNFTRTRRAVSAGVQWKPASELEIYGDFTYNRYDNNQLRQHSSLSSNAGRLYGSETNPLLPGQVTITNGDANGNNGAVTAFTGLRNGQPGGRYNLDGERFMRNESDFKYGGLNVKWSRGPLTATFDYGHSDVKYYGESGQIYSQDIPLDFDYSVVNGLPTFKVNGNVQVPLQVNSWYDEQRVMKAARDAVRFDLRYDLSTNLAFRAGARVERSTVDSRSGSSFIFLPQGKIAFGFPDPNTTESFGTAAPGVTFTAAQIAALDNATYPGGTFSIFPELGIPKFPKASYAGFCSVATVICGYDIRNGSLYNGSFPITNIPGNAVEGVAPEQFSPLNSIYADERNFALYGSVEGKADVGNVPIDGNIGLRAVHLSLFSRGFSSVRTVGAGGALLSQTLLATQDRNKYWEFLPNLNINAHPTDNINLRLGIARSITLPEYADTAPSGVLTIVDPTTPNYSPITNPNTGSFGSTQLKPMSAWGYDLTFEYYTPWRGSVVASAFLKRISDLIFTSTARGVSVPGQSVQFVLSQPINVAKASAKGFEVGFNQPFTFLSSPFDGFGLQANYTFVDTKVNSDLPAAQFGIPGTSRHSANMVAYYEKYGFGARLGVTHRSRTLLGAGLDAVLQDPTTNIDFNTTYMISKNIELNASVVNITGQNRREYIAYRDAVLNYYQRPRVYTFGARLVF